jgi:amino acid transporter
MSRRGYLVACFDSIESVIYVASSAMSIGQMIGAVVGTGRNWEPLYWILFYVSALAIHCWGGKTFWRINLGMAIVSFLIILLFIFGAAHWGNFTSYASLEHETGRAAWFAGGGSEFMRVLPIPAWFFVGVESINLACQDIGEPKKNIPRGYLSCIGTLLLTCVGVLFVAVSLPPGVMELQGELNPLNAGFRLLLNCSEAVATLLALPALYATAFGFMFCYGRQLRSMGNSGILPHYLGESDERRKTPVRALLFGSGIGLSVNTLVHFVPSVGAQLFNICMLGAFSAYFAQFVSYVVFGTLLSNIKREFKSPLGVAGAVYGSAVFLLAFIGIAFFQENYIALIVFVSYVALVTVYYFFVVKHRQFFSNEEKEVLMQAHVVKSE